MTKALWKIVFVTTLIGFAHPALAQDDLSWTACDRTEHPADDVVEQARAEFQIGKKAFLASNYVQAIVSYKAAYRLDCMASLLLRYIGEAHAKMGDTDLALLVLQAYESHPSTKMSKDERRTFDEQINILQHRVDTQREIAASKEAPRQTDSSLDDALRDALNPEKGPGLQTEQKHSHALPIAITVTGSVATIGGFLYFAERRHAISSMEDQCPDHKCPANNLADQGNDANEQSKIGLVVGIAGLAMTAIGATWLALDGPPKEGPKTTAAIAPWIGPKGGGVSYQGHF